MLYCFSLKQKGTEMGLSVLNAVIFRKKMISSQGLKAQMKRNELENRGQQVAPH
jgi:hypothetical protein